MVSSSSCVQYSLSRSSQGHFSLERWCCCCCCYGNFSANQNSAQVFVNSTAFCHNDVGWKAATGTAIAREKSICSTRETARCADLRYQRDLGTRLHQDFTAKPEECRCRLKVYTRCHREIWFHGSPTTAILIKSYLL